MNISPTRFVTFTVVIIVISLLLVVRLFDLQVINGREYARKALREQSSSSVLYDRGTIYFKERTGTLLSAATLEHGYILAIRPNQIKDAEGTFQKINEIYPLDRGQFLEKAGNTADTYEEVARRISTDIAPKISALSLPGVSLYEERWRYYPGNSLASNVLGFVGYVHNKLEGRYGIEQQFESVLQREEKNLYTNFFAQLFSEIGNSIFSSSIQGDVVLTIEPRVQAYLEKSLREIQDKWTPDGVGAIIIDPATGEIAAMAALPNFDPNTYGKEKNTSAFSNPLIEGVYEMGSTFKPLTLAAALDAKAITPTTRYEDKGFVELNGARVSNYDKKGRGWIDMQEVLNQSLNTGTVFALSKLGKDAFRKYMFAYGITDKTGVDLPNESAGLTDNLQSTRDIEYATASFGQGVAVTPITMTRALSSLANGGVLVKPHVVAEIRGQNGIVTKRPVIEQGRVLRTETTEEITRMLVRVVDEALLGGRLKMPHYSIALKTGTAQIAKPTGGYYDDRYMHTFFGYFPAYEPKFLIFMYVYHPRGASYASQTLTSPFMDLAKYLINYYEIPPDR